MRRLAAPTLGQSCHAIPIPDAGPACVPPRLCVWHSDVMLTMLLFLYVAASGKVVGPIGGMMETVRGQSGKDDGTVAVSPPAPLCVLLTRYLLSPDVLLAKLRNRLGGLQTWFNA